MHFSAVAPIEYSKFDVHNTYFDLHNCENVCRNTIVLYMDVSDRGSCLLFGLVHPSTIVCAVILFRGGSLTRSDSESFER